MRYLPALPIIVTLALSGCEEPKGKADVVRIAENAADTLVALRKPAALVLVGDEVRPSPDDIIAACTSADVELSHLRRVPFDAITDGDLYSHVVIRRYAETIVQDRRLFCGHLDTDWGKQRCARWCQVRWTFLVLAVERFRADAARYHVPSVSLAPVPNGIGMRTFDETPHPADRYLCRDENIVLLPP